VGATYEDEAAFARTDAPAMAHEDNRRRLAGLLRDAPPFEPIGSFAGLRCIAPDRLPLAGPLHDAAGALRLAARLRGAHLADLPRQPGLYVLAALGSRGLSLAPLLAELLAAQITGEPAPIESDLIAAVDPARFWLHARRKEEPAAAGDARGP